MSDAELAPMEGHPAPATRLVRDVELEGDTWSKGAGASTPRSIFSQTISASILSGMKTIGETYGSSLRGVGADDAGLLAIRSGSLGSRVAGHSPLPPSERELIAQLDAVPVLDCGDLVMLAPDQTPIGTVTVDRADPWSRACSFWWWLEHHYDTSDYRLRLVDLLLNLYFDELDYARAECHVVDDEPAQTDLEQLGFKIEGVRREAVFAAGKHHDVAVHGLIRSERRSMSQ